MERTKEVKMRTGRPKTHGMTGTPIHNTWLAMIDRCFGKEKFNPSYKRRGIIVCERWLKFENFFEDMGERPFKNAQIERTNNDGNYEPGNCEWTTQKQNSRNRISTIRVEYNDKIMALSEVAEIIGMKPGTLYDRHIKRGWSLHEAIHKPLHRVLE
jgi:hypothetical protein